MFNKTTSIIFQKYGDVYNDFERKNGKYGKNKITKISNKTIYVMYQSTEDVYLRVSEGIVLLVVTNNLEAGGSEQFVVHRVVKIRAGVFYNFISITDSSKIETSALKTNITTRHPIKTQPFTYNSIKPTVNVSEIVSYYYVVRGTNYVFPGEKTNNWEITFIDNGSLNSTVEFESFTLGSYDLIFYAPGQFHTQSTSPKNTCSYLTIVFNMSCIDEEKLKNRVFHIDRKTHDIIEEFVKISNGTMPYDNDLLCVYLQALIIYILQSDSTKKNPIARTPMQQKFESELLNEILIYINGNIYTPLTIEELCEEFGISRSSLQTLFKSNLNKPPKQYISDIKLNKSKLLIKESKYTISEISSILGFASIHYFSRKFKKQFGITPTDYAKTIYN